LRASSSVGSPKAWANDERCDSFVTGDDRMCADVDPVKIDGDWDAIAKYKP
jgi:hypothetical protein